MKLRGKKDDEQTEQLPLPEKQGKDGEKEPKKKKQKEYEGSRWTAIVLLGLTLLAGLWFYFQGTGGWQTLTGLFSGFGGQQVIIFEKN